MRRLLLAFVLLGLVVALGLRAVPSVPAAQDATPSGEAAPSPSRRWAARPPPTRRA